MTILKKPGGFLGHAVSYAVGNVARRLVGFLMLPIYTHYLTPADYGAVGLLTFATALLEPLFGARLAQAVPKFYFEAKDARSRGAVVWSALTVTGLVSALTMIVIILLRDRASRILFGTPDYALATGLFAVNMLSQPIEYTGMLYLRLQERSRSYFCVSMAKLVVQVSLNLLLVVAWRMGVVGVVISGIGSSVATGAGLLLYIAAASRPNLDSQTVRQMLRFSWPLWFAGLAGLYIGSSSAMYLRVFDSLSDVGLLELALRFATVVGVLVWSPFFQHWEPVSYRYHADGQGVERFRVAFVTITSLLLVSGLGVSIFAAPVIRLMAAPSFHAAAKVVPILTLGFILYNLSSFFYFAFFVTDHTKVFSYSRYLTVGVMTVAYVALIPKFGLVGAATSQCLTFAADFAFMFIWSRKYYDPGYDMPHAVLSVLVAAVAYVCADVLATQPGTAVDLSVKSAIFVVAAAIMAAIGLWSIRKASPSSYSAALARVRQFRTALLAR